MKLKVNICGVCYQISQATAKNDSEIKQDYGYCDFVDKKIVLNARNSKRQNRKTLRHEITHALFYECGLSEYAYDETLVDYIAIQLPKLFDLCKHLDILED